MPVCPLLSYHLLLLPLSDPVPSLPWPLVPSLPWPSVPGPASTHLPVQSPTVLQSREWSCVLAAQVWIQVASSRAAVFPPVPWDPRVQGDP